MAELRGARTTLLCGSAIPSYAPEILERALEERAYVETLRNADAVIIGSPVYHGAISDLVNTRPTMSRACRWATYRPQPVGRQQSRL